MAREAKLVDPDLDPKKMVKEARELLARGGNEDVVATLLDNAERLSGLDEEGFRRLQDEVYGGANTEYMTPTFLKLLRGAAVIFGMVSEK